MTEPVDEQPPTSNPIINVPTFSLENILGENHDAVEHPGTNGVSAAMWDEETPETTVAEGFCIECEGEQFPCSSFLRTDNPQTSLHRSGAKRVPMSTVKSALQHNTEKDQENDMLSNPWQVRRRRNRRRMALLMNPRMALRYAFIIDSIFNSLNTWTDGYRDW
jgi:hypothetical protein